MQLEKEFVIEAPLEKAWAALNDPEFIAPCFPGATLLSSTGDDFTGTVRVKLGPIAMTYKGQGTYRERDEAGHRMVIEASGRDARGNSTAGATIRGTMAANGPDRTAVTIVTDMEITGRPAQFGRGVISEVTDRIIAQFALRVAEKLATPAGPADRVAQERATTDRAPAADTRPAPHKPANDDAINLLGVAAAPVFKRIMAAIGAALARITGRKRAGHR